MIRHIYTTCLYFLFSVVVSAQDSTIDNQPADSILKWMQENYTNDSIDLHQIALRTIAKNAHSKDLDLLGALHESLADWHGYHGLTHEDSTIYHMNKSLDYYKELDDKASIARLYGRLSIDLLNAGDLEESQELIFQAIELYEELEDDDGLANMNRSLAYLHDRMGEPETSISYALKAYDYYKSEKKYNRQSYTLLSLIGTYNQTGALEKAQEAAAECIALVDNEIPEQIFVQARAYAYKGEVSLLQGKLEEALKESTRSYDISRSATSDDRGASYRSGIGDVRMAQEKWDEALPHYLATVASADKQGADDLFDIYKKISECYRNTGDYEQSLHYYNRYAQSQIDKNEQTIANLQTEAVVKYETGKKDEAIAHQKEEIERKTRSQRIYIGIVALLASLLGGLFYMFGKNKKANADLEVKNGENEILLKEIHHRVKNNLQILSSLLSLQSDSEEDQTIVGALQESKNRVESMGLIHQKLYTRDNLTSIKMDDYIKELCGQLEDTYSSSGKTISIESDVQIQLADVETAIPLGLIINELVTNSMKYAFNSMPQGGITVKLWEEDRELRLEVADNGNGNVGSGHSVNSTNFGTRLVDILSKKLKGSKVVSSTSGYSTLLTFRRYVLT